MIDPLTLLETLHRPGLLVQAARFALADYCRARQLRRLIAAQTLPGAAEAALRLVAVEADLEQARRGRTATYSPARHVAVLAAIMHEAALLQARRKEALARLEPDLRVVP